MKWHLCALSVAVILMGFSTEPAPGNPEIAPTSAPLAPTKARTPAKPTFLSGDEKVWGEFPPSPVLGSDVAKADLQTVLSLQASRTPEQKAEAIDYKKFRITLMTEVIDPDFKTKYPHVYDLLELADKDAYFITTQLKDKNTRSRPYAQYPNEVQPLYTTGGFSYPSGHASGMQLQARLLAKLFPAKSADLIKRSQQVGESRVVAGVHYPTDVQQGSQLGDLLFAELEANAKFKEALKAASEADHIPAS